MSFVKRLRIEHKLIDDAEEHLRGEEVLALFRGQTAVSPVLIPLVSSLLFFPRPRTVMVTNNTVLTLQQRYWSQSTIARLVSRHECGTVPVQVTRWGLQIGEEPMIYALPSTLGDMPNVERLATRRRCA
jgi:hypothetical protein